MTKNILNDSELKNLLRKVRKEGKKIVFTNGCFDLIHRGHVEYLNSAKEFGDILIVGINGDKSPYFKRKGDNRPIIDEKSRAFVLSNIKPVDFVVIFQEEDPIDLIEKIKPNVHVKGGDYKIEDLIETPILKSLGSKIKIVKLKKGFSTTDIEKKIKNS